MAQAKLDSAAIKLSNSQKKRLAKVAKVDAQQARHLLLMEMQSTRKIARVEWAKPENMERRANVAAAGGGPATLRQREYLNDFPTLSPGEQRRLLMRNPETYFFLPKESLRFDLVLACLASARPRRNARKIELQQGFWSPYIYRIVSHAPKHLQTSLMLAQAILGDDNLSTYVPSRSLPSKEDVATLLDGNTLVNEEFVVGLVWINPWACRVVPGALLTPRVLSAALARASQPDCNIDEKTLLAEVDELVGDAQSEPGNERDAEAILDEALDDVDIASIERALGLVDERGDPDALAIEAALGLHDASAGEGVIDIHLYGTLDNDVPRHRQRC